MSRGEATVARVGFRPSVRQVGAGVLALLVVVFLAQNNSKATISFVFFSLTMRVWLAMALVLGTGIVIGYLLAGTRARRKVADRSRHH